MRTRIFILVAAFIVLTGCVTRTTHSAYQPYAPMSVEPPGVALPELGGASVTQSAGSSGVSSDVSTSATIGMPVGSAEEPFAELRVGVRGQLASGASITTSSLGVFAYDLGPPEPMLTAGMGLRITRPLDRRTSLGVRFSPTMYDTRGSPAMAIDVAAGWARGVGSASHRLFAEARGQLTVFDASGRRRGGWGGVAGGGDFAVARGAVRLRPFVGLHLGRQSVSVEQVRTTTTFNPFDGTSEVDETRSQTDRARTLGRIETGLTVWFGRRTVAPEAAYQPY